MLDWLELVEKVGASKILDWENLANEYGLGILKDMISAKKILTGI